MSVCIYDRLFLLSAPQRRRGCFLSVTSVANTTRLVSGTAKQKTKAEQLLPLKNHKGRRCTLSTHMHTKDGGGATVSEKAAERADSVLPGDKALRLIRGAAVIETRTATDAADSEETGHATKYRYKIEGSVFCIRLSSGRIVRSMGGPRTWTWAGRSIWEEATSTGPWIHPYVSSVAKLYLQGRATALAHTNGVSPLPLGRTGT